MRSKTDRKICGTCEYWTGGREPVFDQNGNPKIEINSQYGNCECPRSRFHMESRKKDLNCKNYSKWTEIL